MQFPKAGIYVSLFVVVAICCATLYALRVRDVERVEDDKEIPWQHDEMSVYVEPERTIATKAFSLADGFEIPSVVNRSYPIYEIRLTEFTNETANETMEAIFGNITDFTTKFIRDRNYGFSYSVPGGVYSILPREILAYFNDSPSSMYTEEEIASNDSLYNGSECRSISDSYVQAKLKDTFALFTYEKRTQGMSYGNDGTFITHYSFRYPRRLENLTVEDEEAGKVLTSISPNGTLRSFMMYMPILERNGTSMPIDPLEAIRKVDNDFSSYTKYLFAGYTNFTLSKVELGYGRVDDRLVIGWILSYICDNDKNLVCSLFVS